MRSNHLFFCYLLLMFFAFTMVASCANQGNITGGEKDEEPPVLLTVNPPNEVTNSTEKEIEFLFNENIKISELKKNLLVSPVLNNDPVIKQKAKSFTLIIEDTLLDNTTYTFNFGNAITDLNEGNAIEGFSYVFSTGDEIDKGRLSGTVIDASTGNAPEDTEYLWATLYKNLNDTAVQTLQPNYVAPINEEGGFQFRNLSEQEYRLYVVKDNNFNFYYDLPDESIAFVDSVFVADTLQQNIQTPYALFVEKDTTLKVSGVSRQGNTFTVKTNLPPQPSNFQDSLNQVADYPADFYQDSVRFWVPESAPENQFYIFQDTVAIDTLDVQAFDTEAVDTTLAISVKNAASFTFQKPLEIWANEPFSNQVDSSSITLLEDSLFVAGGVRLVKDSIHATRLQIEKDWAFNKQYILTFEDSTFQSIYGNYSDSTQIAFQTPSKDELGGINVLLDEVDFDQIILQLYQGNEQLAERIVTKKDPVLFSNLPPGAYQIQVIVDENQNGQWDTGSYIEKRKPETLIRFTQEIKVRSSWTVDAPLVTLTP